MTTYNLTGNIRSGNDSDVQNVTVGDTIVSVVLTNYGPSVGATTNCAASRTIVNGSSSNSTTTFTVVPSAAGAFSAVLNQGYGSRTYTITGTASASGGGGSAYGFQVFDSSGNLIIDSSTPVKTFNVYEQGLTVTLFPNNMSGNTFDYTVPGLTSQADLEANYIFIRRDAGAFSFFGSSSSHSVTYQSANTVRFQYTGACTNVFGNPRTCTILDAKSQVFDVVILGKDLS